ncbi:hypothetical protein DYB30_009243 [Aphanomyces astaci]|uniref:Uncharacterized protein n=1 Tax=Aphanomyces astaci TaxID=112090 RepID=A0A397EVS8_APHAT|nr:hypothetical protein DYB36_009321 [Aphanomyces astaci]RHY54282.1 hypothetical protein DYB30_009243 [Aphanomyces astaci]RHZ02734.1 hypothetical protein DYB31_000890 [Aphanomyces astaci]
MLALKAHSYGTVVVPKTHRDLRVTPCRRGRCDLGAIFLHVDKVGVKACSFAKCYEAGSDAIFFPSSHGINELIAGLSTMFAVETVVAGFHDKSNGPTPNLENTFRWLFEALSVSAVSNQASWTGPCGSRRHPESSLARLLPNGPHTTPAALQRVNEEVESLGDALKQAREERVAEMALREKVEQERDQANTERDNWKSVSGDSGQNSVPVNSELSI